MTGAGRFVPQPSTGKCKGRLRISQITSMDGVDYVVDELVQIGVLLAQSVDFLNGIEHRGVMLASEHASDFWQGGMRQLLDQIHGDLPRIRYLLRVGLL